MRKEPFDFDGPDWAALRAGLQRIYREPAPLAERTLRAMNLVSETFLIKGQLAERAAARRNSPGDSAFALEGTWNPDLHPHGGKNPGWFAYTTGAGHHKHNSHDGSADSSAGSATAQLVGFRKKRCPPGVKGPAASKPSTPARGQPSAPAGTSTAPANEAPKPVAPPAAGLPKGTKENQLRHAAATPKWQLLLGVG